MQTLGTEISFKLDTGAQCNIIPRKVYDRIQQRPKLDEDILWHWTDEHSSAIQSIKKLITQSPVLKYFDPELDTKLSVDASKSSLGGVLLQKHDNDWFPVTYASRAMTPCERSYAQIEKKRWQ